MYIAPGSTNITSDYDIIFIGPESVNIGEFIRNTFIQMYTNVINNSNKEKLITPQKPLTLAGYFDTNIYVIPIFNKYIPFIKSYTNFKANNDYMLTFVDKSKRQLMD